MYKVKLFFVSLTWFWLNVNLRQKNKKQCTSACTGSNLIVWVWLEFNWNSISNQQPLQERVYKIRSCFWVWLEFDSNSVSKQQRNAQAHIQRQTHFCVVMSDLRLTQIHARAHGQNQTHLFEFDFSLTKTQCPTKN